MRCTLGGIRIEAAAAALLAAYCNKRRRVGLAAGSAEATGFIIDIAMG
jgi:hypothetical protein